MNYTGKLYGKGHGRTYFPLVLTSADVDRMEKEHAEMMESLQELLASVTSEMADDTSMPIAWSGSPSQNRRMTAAIKNARAALASVRGDSGQNETNPAAGSK